ncbi:MAG TPA: Hsp20 family protein [Bryobacteraceae bacterium]|nr:Hsp20 family protein [Bryobacteraceae bacterium]
MKPRICITRITDQEAASSTLLAEAQQSLEDIRHRAWDHFQSRGRMVGNDWADWLRAEREAVWKPDAEMFENSRDLVVRVAVPGFDAKSLQITASPRALLIQGRETHRHEGLESRLHFCEFGQRLFRLFDLPARIDPNTVCATLDKGILEIVAGIARQRRAEREAAADGIEARAKAATAVAAAG